MDRDEMRALVKKLTQHLMDEGKIIEAGWMAMRHVALAKTASEAQLHDMRAAFFAGAQHLFGSMMGTAEDPESTTEDRFELILQELRAFAEELQHEGLALGKFNPDDAKPIEDANPEEFTKIQDIVRAGRIELSPEARQQMEAKGLTEDELVAMLRKSMKLDPH